ncbi:MAG TPA: TIGR03084 family metal-binding protein, partial [Actinomycetaceae bacterium]|nr:TIGR03084 family metal-binding protein [Actinomycetaceae bacterium]
MPEDAYTALLADLAAEAQELDDAVATLSPAQWRTPTPAEGWTIAHQIAHLQLTEEFMLLALTDPAAFAEALPGATADPGLTQAQLADPELGTETLAGWRQSRERLLDALHAGGPRDRIPWIGPSLSLRTAATSRIMEIWAHAEDVLTALGAHRGPTHRLRHIAHLAVAARDFSFRNRGLPAPDEPFRVVVHAPGGEEWAWGPPDAAERVTAEAYDFALLATRRLHPDDAEVSAVGERATAWLEVIQAFAGPSGPQRAVRGAPRAT